MESDDLKQLLIDAQHVAEVNESQSEEEAANHSNAQDEEEDSEVNDFVLEQTLGRLEKFLCFLGFRQSSLLGFVISWFAFLILGVSIPIATLELLSRSDCEKYEMNRFEVDIMVPHACLAGVSLICVSHNLRKYGLRRFLFVDRYHGHMIKFRKDYIEKIKRLLNGSYFMPPSEKYNTLLLAFTVARLLLLPLLQSVVTKTTRSAAAPLPLGVALVLLCSCSCS